MALSPIARHRARYLVPIGAAAITAGIVVIPQAASGEAHPNLAPRTAAQLLTSLEQAKVPQFSGTVVETARLGLPNIGDSSLAGAATAGQSGLMQVVTLLTGSHTAQVAYGGPERQRVAIFLSDLSETDVVHNGRDVWTYSSNSNSVTHNRLPAGGQHAPEHDMTTPVNPDKAAQQALARIDPSTRVTVDRTAEVANRAAYQLDLTPRDANTLVSSVRIALDAKTSLPLRVQIWSRGNHSSPAFEVGFTSISLSPPSASTFDFTTPPTATTEPLSSMFTGPLGPVGARRVTTAPRPPVDAPIDTRPVASPEGKDASGHAILGKDWSTVWVQHVPSPPAQSPTPGRPQPPSLGQQLDQLGTRVAGGHLITTTLLSILVTDDNRVLVGPVTPRYLEQVAASKAAQ